MQRAIQSSSLPRRSWQPMAESRVPSSLCYVASLGLSLPHHREHPQAMCIPGQALHAGSSQRRAAKRLD